MKPCSQTLPERMSGAGFNDENKKRTLDQSLNDFQSPFTFGDRKNSKCN